MPQPRYCRGPEGLNCPPTTDRLQVTAGVMPPRHPSRASPSSPRQSTVLQIAAQSGSSRGFRRYPPPNRCRSTVNPLKLCALNSGRRCEGRQQIRADVAIRFSSCSVAFSQAGWPGIRLAGSGRTWSRAEERRPRAPPAPSLQPELEREGLDGRTLPNLVQRTRTRRSLPHHRPLQIVADADESDDDWSSEVVLYGCAWRQSHTQPAAQRAAPRKSPHAGGRHADIPDSALIRPGSPHYAGALPLTPQQGRADPPQRIFGSARTKIDRAPQRRGEYVASSARMMQGARRCRTATRHSLPASFEPLYTLARGRARTTSSKSEHSRF